MIYGSVVFTIMAALARALRVHSDWQWIALARAGLAFVFAAIMTHAAGARLVVWRPRILWMRSTAGSISLLCTFYSLTHPDLSVSEVLTITNIFPVWVAVLSWPMLGEPPPWGVWVSVASGVIGVALIQQPKLAAGNYVVVVPVIASLATAVAMMGLHRLRSINSWAVVAHFSGVATLICTVALLVGPHHVEPTALLGDSTLLCLLGVGASATLGQFCLTKAFAAGAPAKVSVVGLTQIVMALALDVSLFGVAVDQRKLLGMGLILVPTAWIMLRGLRGPRVVVDTPVLEES
jgi:drug/metabolite transporter (DMT)-like permease